MVSNSRNSFSYLQTITTLEAMEEKQLKEPISIQKLRLENQLLWKFVAEISDQSDTYNGKLAYALIKRFKKSVSACRKSRMRLPSIKL
jgi:hypothetical protein